MKNIIKNIVLSLLLIVAQAQAAASMAVATEKAPACAADDLEKLKQSISKSTREQSTELIAGITKIITSKEWSKSDKSEKACMITSEIVAEYMTFKSIHSDIADAYVTALFGSAVTQESIKDTKLAKLLDTLRGADSSDMAPSEAFSFMLAHEHAG